MVVVPSRIFTSTSAEMPRPAMPLAVNVTVPPVMLTEESLFIQVAYDGEPPATMLLPVITILISPPKMESRPLFFIPFDASPGMVILMSAPPSCISPAALTPFTSSPDAVTVTSPPSILTMPSQSMPSPCELRRSVPPFTKTESLA